MADTSTLVVRVKSDGVTKTQRDLGGLSSAAKTATASVAGLVSVGSGLNKLVDVSRKTDILNASLITMTGSAESAGLAFAEIEKFARETPYALDQSVTAFTKLVSLGLTPSQKALESYGNTASAMGKDLNQMIEAVADATTFEFERLKEFGIKSKQEGDKVSFTFQGVTTTVKKNSEEIEGYLMALGKNQFAGAMANRMATLDGAMSNLQDSWDGLFRAISSQGAGGVIEDQVRTATYALNELNAMISSGQALASIQAWGGQWEDTANDIKMAVNDADLFIKEKLIGFGLSAEQSSNLMSDAFWQFPANIRAIIQIATVEIAGFVDKTRIWGKALDPSNWMLTVDEFGEKYAAEFQAIDNTVISTASMFLDQREARISKLNSEVEAAKNLRAEYDKSAKMPGTDLGSFKINAPESSGSEPSESEKKEAAKLDLQKKSAEAYLEQLRQSNLNEKEIIEVNQRDKAQLLADYYTQGLIDEKQYQDGLTEIQNNASTSRAELEIKFLDEKAKRLEEIRHAEIAMAKEESAAKEKMIDDGIDAGHNMTSNLRRTMGEQSSIYKASAIAMATIDTYKAANAAYAAMAGIPAVGPALGIAAAGFAVTAGLAQVSAIRGAREQGGYMSAGSPYQMAERGQAEVIVPAGNSRAKTKKQMAEMMGGGTGATSVVIVNQTTGRIDNAESGVDDEGRIRIIIREEVSSGLLNQDSQIAKARKNTRGQPGY